jgi:hypothetical protein
MIGSSRPLGSAVSTWVLVVCSLLGFLLGTPTGTRAQDRGAEATYLRIVSEEYRISVDEARDLIRAGAQTEELPVLLRLSRQSGISPSVLLALHRRGNSWIAVAGRYRLGAGTFHIEIPPGQVDDRVRRAHDLFQATPREGWNTLALSDPEVVVLANLHLLTRGTGSTPGQVLQARARTDSFPEAVRLLVVR